MKIITFRNTLLVKTNKTVKAVNIKDITDLADIAGKQKVKLYINKAHMSQKNRMIIENLSEQAESFGVNTVDPRFEPNQTDYYNTVIGYKSTKSVVTKKLNKSDSETLAKLIKKYGSVSLKAVI